MGSGEAGWTEPAVSWVCRDGIGAAICAQCCGSSPALRGAGGSLNAVCARVGDQFLAQQVPVWFQTTQFEVVHLHDAEAIPNLGRGWPTWSELVVWVSQLGPSGLKAPRRCIWAKGLECVL